MRQNNRKQLAKPDLADVLENLKDDIFKTLNCVQVGEIQSFNATRQTASVLISIKQVVEEANGTQKLQSHPLLLECPVLFLGGTESYLTINPQVGDGCIVLFNDRDFENWFYNGGEEIPNTFRRHDKSDAIALVGLRNLQKSIQDFYEDGVRLQHNASNKIELSDGKVLITTPLTEATADMLVNGNSTVKLNKTVEGSATIQQGLAVGGTVTKFGGGGAMEFNTDITQTAGKVLKAGNGATGSFTSADGKTIVVNDGIITSIT